MRQNTRIWQAADRASGQRGPVYNGGYSRVGQEQEQSQKVKLSLDAMRPDRCSYVCQPGASGFRAGLAGCYPPRSLSGVTALAVSIAVELAGRSGI
jgi:hypothetical protein